MPKSFFDFPGNRSRLVTRPLSSKDIHQGTSEAMRLFGPPGNAESAAEAFQAGRRAVGAFQRGDLGEAAGQGGLAVLGAIGAGIPGLGGILARLIKAGRLAPEMKFAIERIFSERDGFPKVQKDVSGINPDLADRMEGIKSGVEASLKDLEATGNPQALANVEALTRGAADAKARAEREVLAATTEKRFQGGKGEQDVVLTPEQAQATSVLDFAARVSEREDKNFQSALERILEGKLSADDFKGIPKERSGPLFMAKSRLKEIEELLGSSIDDLPPEMGVGGIQWLQALGDMGSVPFANYKRQLADFLKGGGGPLVPGLTVESVTQLQPVFRALESYAKGQTDLLPKIAKEMPKAEREMAETLVRRMRQQREIYADHPQMAATFMPWETSELAGISIMSDDAFKFHLKKARDQFKFFQNWQSQ